MVFKDYYKILELDTNKVDLEHIKIAFRELAKKYHPDVNIGSRKAEERFKDINEAYQVLTNSIARKKYDKMWNTHIGSKKRKFNADYVGYEKAHDSVFGDFFNMFFGDVKDDNEEKGRFKKKVAIKGDNIESEIKISINEAFYGMEKKISLRTLEGKMKTFTVKVPAGIRNNEKIRLIGQGKKGVNGGKNGDMLIKIRIENSAKFKLEGADIITDLLLNPWEAALGTRITIQSIDESAVIYVPPGIQSGEKIKIPKKGYKDGKGGRGDLIAEVKIMVPKSLTDDEKNLFENLGKISKFNPRTKKQK